MTERSHKYLKDVLMALELIEHFTQDVADFRTYEADRKTQSAVERQLSIVGEALSQLRKSDPGMEIQNAHQIIGFRNRLIHSYDSIDNAIVWAILHLHIRPLRSEIEALLR
jgi:uncharacterized protein with HEPN domain